MKEWFKARNIWGAAIMALSDAEAGRLMKALWTYTMTGEQQNLSGAEKAIFAMILMTLGQDEQKDANISTMRAAAGSTGGKQTQANASKRKQKEQTEANQSICSNKNKNKEEEKEIDNNNHSSARANPFTVSDDELAEALERDRKIEDASRAWGLPCNEGNMIKARDMAREYTLEWLLRAIETAGNGKEQTWRYVDGILKSWKDNGGPDAPRKQTAKPAKVVSAQQYTQRQYAPGELDAVSDDLMEEARKQRDTA